MGRFSTLYIHSFIVVLILLIAHSCYLPAQNSSSAAPCALCSACRDWNLGEFCPWDLTGIIGDMSADSEVTEKATKPVMVAESSSTDESAGEETPAPADVDSIPQEIVHSTSAADFMSTMDIESW